MQDNHKGFTLIELMIAMAISLIVMAGIYSAYQSQQKSHDIQIQVAAMQQNLRAAMFYMEREIRMAGCDPKGNAAPAAAIIDAQANSIEFRSDIRGNSVGTEPDGETDDDNEHIEYRIYDALGDGVNDIGRDDKNGMGLNAIALNIDVLDFVYLDRNGNVTAVLANIRAVEVTLVARAGRADRGRYINNKVYRNKQGTIVLPAQNDSFRRKILNMHVDCRNLGI
ncbi:MAG: prepilin-type N-terminal cleavage/methylation domain-containing protein [Desulfobacteraceae bacterium]|nr:prepilin-type N-terminal cleavage/methylation domain-containing protein [Desulfobacteraceae bacterium]